MTAPWKEVLLPRHPVLRSLLEFDAEVAQAPRVELGEALAPIGLLLHDDVGGYWCTPTNAVGFASTGGDGVHYSLLRLPDRPEVDWPVVMTVPMQSDLPNLVVGSSLQEFLALGCFYGYFALDALVYAERDQTIAELERGAPLQDSWPEKERLLSALRERFTLEPWRGVGGRLEQLQREYGPLLEVAPPPEIEDL
jgi:hypothetical protein